MHCRRLRRVRAGAKATSRGYCFTSCSAFNSLSKTKVVRDGSRPAVDAQPNAAFEKSTNVEEEHLAEKSAANSEVDSTDTFRVLPSSSGAKAVPKGTRVYNRA